MVDLYDADTRRAARALYSFVYDFAARAAARLLIPEADRGDVAQQVVIKAHKSWSRYDESRGSPAQWLGGIVRHEVQQYWRDRGRRLARVAEDVGVDVDTFESPTSELGDLLDAAFVLERIPEAQRVVVWARVMGGFTFATIGEMQGTSRMKAYQLHEAGMQRLRSRTPVPFARNFPGPRSR